MCTTYNPAEASRYGWNFTGIASKTALFPVKDEARRDADSCPPFHFNNKADRDRRKRAETPSRPAILSANSSPTWT